MEVKEDMQSSAVIKEGIAPAPAPAPASATENYQMAARVENTIQFGGSSPQTVAPVTSSSAAIVAVGSSEGKKKRGRPRKYGPDGKITMALSPMPISASIPLSGDFSGWNNGRGRPVDSFKKKHKLESHNPGERVAYSVGANFTPHVITVHAGEDVNMKIISFSQQGSRAICILAANGAISNVTLRQPNSSGGTLTYEGRFEILSLSGSFMPTDNGVTKSRSGGMSVSLAGPDGRVLGGGLAGLLVAAGPVQVVIGSFLPGHQQEQKPKKQRLEPTTAFAPIPLYSISGEQGTEGAYSGSKPNLTSTPFHIENLAPASVNSNHGLKNLSMENNISSAAAEPKDLNSSKCEVSC